MQKIGVGYVSEDGDGKNYRIKVFLYSNLPEQPAGETIEVYWLSEQNRITPPSVYEGETVEVFATENSDFYYWKPVKYETDLRCHENVTYAWSNKKEKDNTALNSKNSHSLTVDATNKVIAIHTSTNRGEKAGYDIVLNLKDGVLTIKDTHDHIIKLDSVNNKLYHKVEHVEYECETFDIKASKSITLNTPKYTLGGGSGTVNSTITQNKKIDINGKLTQNASSSFNSAVKMNNNAKTTVGPHGHVHTIV